MQKKPQPPSTGWKNHDNGRWPTAVEFRPRAGAATDASQTLPQQSLRAPLRSGCDRPCHQAETAEAQRGETHRTQDQGPAPINPRHYVLTAGRQGPQARSPLTSFTPDIDAGRQKSMECYSHFLDDNAEPLRGHTAFPESPREGHGQPQVSLV